MEPRQDFYDMAGLMTLGAGTLLDTHFGDDLAYFGFQKSGEDAPADIVDRASWHPVFAPSVQLVGVVALVALILYMDHRIKVPVKIG